MSILIKRAVLGSSGPFFSTIVLLNFKNRSFCLPSSKIYNMNTICALMTDIEIGVVLGTMSLVIAIVAIYRTAVANRKQENHH